MQHGESKVRWMVCCGGSKSSRGDENGVVGVEGIRTDINLG